MKPVTREQREEVHPDPELPEGYEEPDRTKSDPKKTDEAANDKLAMEYGKPYAQAQRTFSVGQTAKATPAAKTVSDTQIKSMLAALVFEIDESYIVADVEGHLEVAKMSKPTKALARYGYQELRELFNTGFTRFVAKVRDDLAVV